MNRDRIYQILGAVVMIVIAVETVIWHSFNF